MRLASFNLLHGRSTSDGVVDLDRLAAAVRTLNPDILGLQEVDRDQPRSHLADLTAVAAEAMGAVTHRFAAALSGTPGATWLAATEDDVPGTAAYGVALLSRYPARSWQVLRLPRIPFRFPFYVIRARKMIIVEEEPRTVVVGRLDTPAGPLTVANTHLSYVPGWGQWQLQQIRQDLARETDPVVLMGDLNMRGLLPSLITGYTSLAQHPTFPVDEPDAQLDHILLRGQLGPVVGTDAPRLPLSDHRALTVDLSVSRSEHKEATSSPEGSAT
jgi:endonuclease/exonuclease/phosphatase family metal-dependent hydrolase